MRTINFGDLRFHLFGFRMNKAFRGALESVARRSTPMDYYLVNGSNEEVKDIFMNPIQQAFWEGGGPGGSAANTLFRNDQTIIDSIWNSDPRTPFQQLADLYGVPDSTDHLILLWPPDKASDILPFGWASVLFHECYHAANHEDRGTDIEVVAEDEEEAYAATREFILHEWQSAGLTPEERDNELFFTQDGLETFRIQAIHRIAEKEGLSFADFSGDGVMIVGEELDDYPDDVPFNIGDLPMELADGSVSERTLALFNDDLKPASFGTTGVEFVVRLKVLAEMVRQDWVKIDGGYESPLMAIIRSRSLADFLLLRYGMSRGG